MYVVQSGPIYRFGLDDPEQKRRMEQMDLVFKDMKPSNPAWVAQFVLPSWMASPFAKDILGRHRFFFDFFDELYEDHERTFDPEQPPRDFIDAYVGERRRTSGSSFDGDEGLHNYHNTVLDLFGVILEQLISTSS